MKKRISVFLIAVLVCVTAFCAVGCGPEKHGGKIQRIEYDVEFDLPASYTATIKVLRPAREYEKKILNAAIAGFNELYPNITVEQNTVVLDSYNEDVFKQSRAKILPDIVWTDSSKFYFLVSNGIALNLEPFYEQATRARVFDYEKDFSADFRNMAKFGDLTFATPRSADSVVTFYNKEILTAAGVDLNVNFNARWGEGAQNVRTAGSENYIGAKPFSEPETVALAEFTRKIKPVLTLSYHAKGREIYYEFGQSGERLRRDRAVAEYAVSLTGYRLIEGTRGSAGGYKDWCVQELKIPSLTIELVLHRDTDWI